MQGHIFKIIILPSLFMIILSVLYYQKVQIEVNKLIHERYTQILQNEEKQLSTLIQEKKESILALSLAISQYTSVKNVLNHRDSTELKLKNFSETLKQNTSLKTLWFQVLSKDGISFYRSFSNKTGDNLTELRPEVKQLINHPSIFSTISVGKFNLTFKALVPIYDGLNFIGLFETLARFDSIIDKMHERSTEIILLVDKKYKKQLTHPFSNNFIDDYYIANKDADYDLLSYIKQVSPEKISTLAPNKYLIEKDFLISSYPICDALGEEMAYAIFFKHLNDIGMSDIQQIQYNVFLLLGIILLIFYICIIYIYRKMQQEKVEKRNEELEENIKLKNQVLEYVSLHDSLTSLPNRKFLKRKLLEMSQEINTNKKLYLFHIGIDKFKEVNEVHGHKVGNIVLKNVSSILQEIVDKNTLVSRLSADEFALALVVHKEEDIKHLIASILKSLQNTQKIKNKQFSITASIGVASIETAKQDINLLFRNADTAMYQAKSLGGNTYQFYTEDMTTSLLDKIKLGNDLKFAIENNEFEPHFQPQIDVRTNTLVGMEGLIRWRHPKLGLIYPDRFIPYAEESGLIVAIDRLMMQTCMKIMMTWDTAYTKDLKLSLNLSALNLESPNFMFELVKTLEDTGFNPKQLELEMLESQIMKDPENSIKLLHELKVLGISLSIDDFGTGYSSLSLLKKLPLTKLKIDKSFVDNIPDDKDDVAIVQTIIALTNALELKIVAEGVETEKQKDFLTQNECFIVQGYLYSKPLSREDFKEFMIKFPN